MGEDTDRPQDVGRRHRATSPEGMTTGALLERYQDTMRRHLSGILDELDGRPLDAGVGLDGKPIVKLPTIADRSRLWDLGIKLAAALGAAIDPPKPPGSATSSRSSAGPRRIRKGDA